jgi:hypothetical protein
VKLFRVKGFTFKHALKTVPTFIERMTLMRPTVWLVGIIVAALVVALLRLHGVKDQLTVHLVDQNKKPVSASVTVKETRLYPFLGSMKFLPSWARAATTSNQVNAIDGIVKVHRVNGPGNEALLLIRAKMEPSEFLIFLIGKTNGAGLSRWPDKPRPPRRRIGRDGKEYGEVVILTGGAEWERIKPERTEVSVILD